MTTVQHYRTQDTDLAIQLAPAAQQHLQKFLTKRPQCVGVEFTLSKSGCSGYAYVVNLLDALPAAHTAVECAGIAIYIPREHQAVFQGMVVDYVKEGLNEKFVFNNPNEQARCGCGESILF
jgi:iron-sulfur cluster assembly protein